MVRTRLTPAVMDLVAERFRALGEPARLQILSVLRDGEHTVTDLTGATGLSQANVSKHLQLLHAQGFVGRRKEGLFTWYSVADRSIYELCDLMCGHLDSEVRIRRELLARPG